MKIKYYLVGSDAVYSGIYSATSRTDMLPQFRCTSKMEISPSFESSVYICRLHGVTSQYSHCRKILRSQSVTSGCTSPPNYFPLHYKLSVLLPSRSFIPFKHSGSFSIQSMYVFHMILVINMDSFPKLL
jgi:hypothetical protein